MNRCVIADQANCHGYPLECADCPYGGRYEEEEDECLNIGFIITDDWCKEIEDE